MTFCFVLGTIGGRVDVSGWVSKVASTFNGSILKVDSTVSGEGERFSLMLTNECMLNYESSPNGWNVEAIVKQYILKI